MTTDKGTSTNRTVYVLTRTAGRPKYFERCAKSVRDQSYPYVVHVVGVENDDRDTFKYVQAAELRDPEIVTYRPVPAKIANENPRFYNRYLDHLHCYVEELNPEAWITYLDDDDIFTSEHSLQTMMTCARLVRAEMVIARSRVPGLGKIPKVLGLRPEANEISGLGWAFKVEHAPIWKIDRDANYLAAQDVWDSVKHPVAFTPHVVATLQRGDGAGGYGARDDLGDTAVPDHAGLE
jgi:GT2 family glycosyltransferase